MTFGRVHIKRLATCLLSTCLILALTGCATQSRQPGFIDVRMTPYILKPGDQQVLIIVKINDRFDTVTRLEGVVKEDPSIVLPLVDDGTGPDEKANDDIWVGEVDVPFDAPPGEFDLEITAYNINGERVLIRNEEEEVMPLVTNVQFVIRYPEKE